MVKKHTRRGLLEKAMLFRYYIILLFVVALTGCSTLNSVRKTIFADEGIDGKDKIEYAKVIEEKEAEFREYRETNRSFMPFHYAGIMMVIAGFLCAAFGTQDIKDEGIMGVGMGFGLSAWALIAPRHPDIVGFAFFLFMVAGIVLVFYYRRAGKSTQNEL
jgi:hypothetical protein